MNNSQIALENVEETEDNRLSFLQKQQGELVKLVEAINQVEISDSWRELKKLLLDGVVESLEKNLKSEAEKSEVSLPKIYRLQGQLEWAKKYVDLKKMVDWKKVELESIKNQIKHELNPRDGAL
jgi:hypothetical protein